MKTMLNQGISRVSGPTTTRIDVAFGKIEKKSRWKWSRDEDDFVKIERMLEIFKDGVRPPSNFRKIKEWKDEEWKKYELE